jgi:hypothetical protein
MSAGGGDLIAIGQFEIVERLGVGAIPQTTSEALL